MEKRNDLCPYTAVVLFDHRLSRVTTLGHESILLDSSGTFCEREIGLLPRGAARCSAWQKFVASLSQIPPIGPVLPTPPIHKPFTVYNLAGDSFHGMEEIIGSSSPFEGRLGSRFSILKDDAAGVD